MNLEKGVYAAYTRKRRITHLIRTRSKTSRTAKAVALTLGCVLFLGILAGPASARWLRQTPTGSQQLFILDIRFEPIGPNKMVRAKLDRNAWERNNNAACGDTAANNFQCTCLWVEWRLADSGWEELKMVHSILSAAKLTGLPVEIFVDSGQLESGNDNICHRGGEVVLGWQP